MIYTLIFCVVLIVCVVFIAIIELSDAPGNNIFDQRAKAKKVKMKTLVKENVELKEKVAELEQYRQNQELVLNWVDPRMKELDGPKE